MSSNLAIGDILEFECLGGWCYLSYAGKEPTMGDSVWVIPRIFPAQQKDWANVFSHSGFWLFYPAHASLRAKLVRRVGYSEEAIRMLPRFRRNIVHENHSGFVASWYITDGRSRVPKLDSELTEEERQLPISEIWNHAFLLEQLESRRLLGR
jgi:hypothetical protein